MKNTIILFVAFLVLIVTPVFGQGFHFDFYPVGVVVEDKSKDQSAGEIAEFLSSSFKEAIELYLSALREDGSVLNKTVGPITSSGAIVRLSSLSLTVHVSDEYELITIHRLPKIATTDADPFVIRVPKKMCSDENLDFACDHVALHAIGHLVNSNIGTHTENFSPADLSAGQFDFIMEQEREVECLVYFLVGEDKYTTFLQIEYNSYLDEFKNERSGIPRGFDEIKIKALRKLGVWKN